MPHLPVNLIGDVPEIVCSVNGINCKGLIDTGSQITTISHSFFVKHFPDVTIQKCSQLLRVEGAGGNSLPYSGFSEVCISLGTISQRVPVLIVQDTSYNTMVPVLLGTNFLQALPYDCLATLPSTVKMAVALLQVRAELLEKADGLLGEVSAAADVTVHPHSSIITNGTSIVSIPLRQQLAVIEPVDGSYPVVSGVVEISTGSFTLPVEIENRTDYIMKFKKGDKIACLSLATIQVPDDLIASTNDLLSAFNLSDLADDDTAELKNFLSKNHDVFALSTAEMGCTDVVTHKIELSDPTPVKDKVRPIPPGAYTELKKHLAELLSAGVIKESKSPFSSNTVLVRKKDGSLRLCVDYRRLNAKTIRDAYTIPRVDTLLDSLKGARYFASLDLLSGYHQVKMHPEHAERTAFSAGPFGFYQYEKMPFGLTNSPSTFQRLMEKVLEGLNLNTCAVYLDDVIVFAETKAELYVRLNEVFDRFRQANLKMKPKKCEFLKTRIDFLGYVVSKDGISCSDNHLKAVADWPVPSNLKELQTFLGFINFYRRFIPGFAAIAEPLHVLLRGRGRGACKKISPPKFSWGEEQQLAFQTLKSKLLSPPILSYPDFDKCFIVHVDASRNGLGAALYQESENGLKAIAYASTSLKNSERNYSAHKLEFLAFKWAVTDKFHHFLYGQPNFHVFTDHNPLAYVTTTARLDATGQRWLAELSKYNFHIFYKPGNQNADADGLSRRPHPDAEQQHCTRHISPEVFKEICFLVANDKDFAGLGETLGLPPTVYVNALSVSPVQSIDWAVEQRKDPDLLRVIELVKKGHKLTPRQRRKETHGVTRLLSYWSSLSIKGDVLYKSSTVYNELVYRVVIPSSRKETVLSMIHDDVGHLGRDKTFSLAQERFFWVGLLNDIERKIKTCLTCICSKSPHLPQRAPLVNISTTRPLELVCMDFLSLEMSKGGFQNILVITDHFTKYALAFPTRNQEARTVAKILFDQFIVHYGIPERLHSDLGANFESKVIKHLCDLLGIKKSHTTPYHPQGDGVTERFNRTLLSMLKTLDSSHKANWKDHIAPLVHAYNCTRHATTLHTPFFLMFGRTPRLPVDMFLGISANYGSSVTNVQERLASAYQAATDAAKQAAKQQAKGYNKKVRGPSIQVGEFVLVKNVGLKGKHKLADKWKSDKYIVIAQPNPDIPVYKVKRENANDVKTLHRNMLLPLVLPFQDPPSAGVTNSVTNPVFHSDGSEEDYMASSDSDEFSIHISDDYLVSDSGLTPVTLPVPRTVLPTASPDILPEASHHNSPRISIPPMIPPTLPEPDNVIISPPQQATEPHLRRSERVRKKPARFDDFILSKSHIVCREDWRDRVTILLHMIDLFPMQDTEICNTILHVIAHCG